MPKRSIEYGARTCEISYEQVGSGNATLLFIHGLGVDRSAWNELLQLCAADFDCIAIDIPGHGGSRPLDTFDLDQIAVCINKFVEQISHKPNILIGHALGGQIAMKAVTRQHELWDRIILLSPFGFEQFSQEEIRLLQQLYSDAYLKEKTVQDIKHLLHSFVYDPSVDSVAQCFTRYKRWMSQKDNWHHFSHLYAQGYVAMLQQTEFAVNLGVDMLILWASNDQIIPHPKVHAHWDIGALILSAIIQYPEAEIEVVDRAGHFIHWDRSEYIYKRIKLFSLD